MKQSANKLLLEMHGRVSRQHRIQEVSKNIESFEGLGTGIAGRFAAGDIWAKRCVNWKVATEVEEETTPLLLDGTAEETATSGGDEVGYRTKDSRLVEMCLTMCSLSHAIIASTKHKQSCEEFLKFSAFQTDVST